MWQNALAFFRGANSVVVHLGVTSTGIEPGLAAWKASTTLALHAANID